MLRTGPAPSPVLDVTLVNNGCGLATDASLRLVADLLKAAPDRDDNLIASIERGIDKPRDAIARITATYWARWAIDGEAA